MTKNIVFICAIASLTLFSCKKNNEGDEFKKFFDSRGAIGQSVTTPEKAVKHNDEPTEMTFDKMSHDFGTINQGDKVTTEFGFTNTGKADLVIYEAKGSCGCTVPEYPKTPIKQGEKGAIKVQFNSAGKTGKQEKSVYISTNSKNGNEVLKITADIKE